MPNPNYQCNPSGFSTIWYCNAGALVFPQEILQRLGPAWRKYNEALIERLDLQGQYKNHCDQASLSLAFAAEPVPFRELPLRMNFPLHLTHLNLPSIMQECDPVILHYHHLVDASGYLMASPYPGAQKRIQQFNQRLHEERRKRLDNRLFWDFRYVHAPELGSGLGSRGSVCEYKQQLLVYMMNLYQPRTILDVGCGDQVVSKVLPDETYTGIDISPVVIERNLAAYPNRHFVCGDVMNLDLPPADLVVCLDVLIHIDNADRYQALVNRLVQLTKKAGMISGYEVDPDIDHDITFYHVSLSKTLEQAGARNLRQIGRYRDVVLWSYEIPSKDSTITESSTIHQVSP